MLAVANGILPYRFAASSSMSQNRSLPTKLRAVPDACLSKWRFPIPVWLSGIQKMVLRAYRQNRVDRKVHICRQHPARSTPWSAVHTHVATCLLRYNWCDDRLRFRRSFYCRRRLARECLPDYLGCSRYECQVDLSRQPGETWQKYRRWKRMRTHRLRLTKRMH